ncbi:MAG: hypothetical protein ACYC35_21055 [Pirellulales bacterium]
MVTLLGLVAAGCSDAEPKPPVYSDETRLIVELARRLPRPWFLQEAAYGRVKPASGSEADGLHLVLWEMPKTYDEYKAGKGNRIHLYWMASGYSAKEASGEGKPGTTATITWHGRVLVVSRPAPATWPDFKATLSSALQAAEHDPVVAKDGANAFVGRVDFGEIHVYTSDERHGFYFEGKITDSLTGRVQSFVLRPWSHTGSKLEGGNGKEYIIVGGKGNDDWGFTAIVPLTDIDVHRRSSH